MARLWLANLEAELELAGIVKDIYQSIERRPQLVGAAARLWLPGDFVLVRRGVAVIDDAGQLGPSEPLLFEPESPPQLKAWCPTPLARAALMGRTGLPLGGPLPEVIARVLSRRFALETLGPALPMVALVQSFDELVLHVATNPKVERWLARPLLGFAGKGRRVFGKPDEQIRKFADKSRRIGGLVVEPLLAVCADFSLHGHLAADGALVIGDPVCSEVRSGTWQSTRRAQPDDLLEQERRALRTELERAALALRTAGYFGPFGLDAFRYQGDDGTRFCARSEVNARYSMAFGLGMAENRPDFAT